MKYCCIYCGYIYEDPEVSSDGELSEDKPAFTDLPKDWKCPKCFADTAYFTKIA